MTSNGLGWGGLYVEVWQFILHLKHHPSRIRYPAASRTQGLEPCKLNISSSSKKRRTTSRRFRPTYPAAWRQGRRKRKSKSECEARSVCTSTECEKTDCLFQNHRRLLSTLKRNGHRTSLCVGAPRPPLPHVLSSMRSIPSFFDTLNVEIPTVNRTRDRVVSELLHKCMTKATERSWVFRYVVLSYFSLLVSCSSTTGVLTQRTRPYNDLVGVSLGSPSHRDGRIHIPVTPASNGNTFFPTESATWIQRFDVSRTGTKIRFSVVTALEEPTEPVKHEVVLENLDPGTYSVEYKDPDGTLHPVGEVTIQEPLQ